MLAHQERLLDFLGNPSAKFCIPVFQRSYAWESTQCDELWRDILLAAEEQRDHFTGILLYLQETDTNDKQIVDGQQRLVTISLLLQALCEYLEEQNTMVFDELSTASLRETYLLKDGFCKLRLNVADDAAYQACILGEEHCEGASQRVEENLKLFRTHMQEDGFDPQKLWKGLTKLYSIVVELDRDDACQDIFESFNSKGVQLTTADLCRNYLLVSLSQDEQTRIYEEHWEPIQDLFGDDPGSLRLNNAILGWLTIRFRRIRAKGDKQAFYVFKRYMREEFTGTVEQLLAELGNFCKVWAENYRYHAVKAYKSASNWATLGAKTLVSDRPLKEASPEARQFYKEHFNVDLTW